MEFEAITLWEGKWTSLDKPELCGTMYAKIDELKQDAQVMTIYNSPLLKGIKKTIKFKMGFDENGTSLVFIPKDKSQQIELTINDKNNNRIKGEFTVNIPVKNAGKFRLKRTETFNEDISFQNNCVIS